MDTRQALSELRRYDFGKSTEPLECILEHRAVLEKELIALLDTTLPPGALKFVCQTLWQIGAGASIDALASKLTDADGHVVEAACFAIGTRPSIKADAALRKGLQSSAPKLPLILLAGSRKDTGSVPHLVKIANSSDRIQADAAAMALGKIASREAIAALSALTTEAAGLALLQAAQEIGNILLLQRLDTDARSPLVRRGARSLLATLSTTDEGFHPLFNGRDLSQFVIDTPGLWSVRNGVIIGRSPGLKYNEFLRTRATYADFTLHARLRMIDGLGNSGFQFRSQEIPGSHEVSGYQADAGERYWGALYDESRRKKTLAAPGDWFLETFDPTIWHSYIVSAHGDHITIDLDGVRTVDYRETEPGIARDGIIALQVHAWPTPVEMWFKDLRIKAA